MDSNLLNCFDKIFDEDNTTQEIKNVFEKIRLYLHKIPEHYIELHINQFKRDLKRGRRLNQINFISYLIFDYLNNRMDFE